MIEDLRKSVSRQDDERTLLRERLDEVEVALRRALDEHEAAASQSRSLVDERRRSVEEYALQVDQLKEQLSHHQDAATQAAEA